MLAHPPRSPLLYVTRQWASRDPRQRKINNVGVAKQVVEKGLDGRGRIRPAQLKQNHTQRFFARACRGLEIRQYRLAHARSGRVSWTSRVRHGVRSVRKLRGPRNTRAP